MRLDSPKRIHRQAQQEQGIKRTHSCTTLHDTRPHHSLLINATLYWTTLLYCLEVCATVLYSKDDCREVNYSEEFIGPSRADALIETFERSPRPYA